ncbi:hypothetical protein Trco_005553 [Trichoderma cornu-damae]|uniref:Uncharacterized protein n=1 Tax=Trichoderma cornu-damae TaxID=654480 RepID=A0A9P8QJ72_9HYPO|nr:hypothetical protein Trco_005553 [Trichoderma cornu-damae]
MEPHMESNGSDASAPHSSKTKSLKPANPQSQQAATQRETSPERKLRHHLCTGCGKVRSSHYHSKHPIVPGGKPSMNYCEDCFGENVEKGSSKHHFCYGCGAARSKEFHQCHPISIGDRPFPNYCSICVEEIRSAETIADVSVVNFAPSRSHESNARSNIGHDCSGSNEPTESLKPRQGLNNQESHPDVVLPSVHADKHSKIDGLGQKKIPQPLKLSTGVPQLSPSNSSPDSPYYPPQGERLDRPIKVPNSDVSQEASDDSTEGQASTDDSAHSTGSKTVKFRPKVDIRLSDSRTSSNASSHAKILEEDIKPDDDTIPSRRISFARRGGPTAYHSTTPPSMESFTGFRPGSHSTFNYGSSGGGTGSKWAKEYQSTTKVPKRAPYWIPEPIIEEPDSPVSSPGKQTTMLEFTDIDISPASASNAASRSSSDSEDDSAALARHEPKSDDDSDEENTLSKSSLETPSLD